MSRPAILTAAAVLALSFGAAHAEDRPSMTLKTSDLDLSSPRDVKRLYARVAEAAGEVCGRPALAVFIPAPPPEFTACRDATIDTTLAQIHAPLVQALRKDRALASAQH